MPADFVFPEGNEKSLVEMAKRLGFDELYLCYPLAKAMKEVSKLSTPDLRVALAILVTRQQDVQSALKLSRDILAPGRQEFFEDKRVKYVINFESEKRPDFVHHRNSGLNQVFIKKAIRSQKTILVNARQLFFPVMERNIILGRIQQNNVFFKKYKPDTMVVSGASRALEMRSPRDLQNLLLL